MHTFTVELGERSYPIHIGAGVLETGDLWQPLIHGRHVLLVSNTTVAPLYAARVEAQLGAYKHAALVLPDGEQYKTLDTVTRIFTALADLGATRDACVLALGGGVIGDMAGFAAACWMRGIDFIQMPTTLLAMIDASVGGKTGANVPAGKNLIGAFHQPRAVIADTAVLASLPAREFHAGLAEAIKHSALGDAEFFDHVEAMQRRLMARESDAIGELIAHSCRFKAGVVARDETEHGERALLNFGHTFGHALEVSAGYGTLLHGEAVAIGMCLATRLSTELGMAPQADAQRLQQLLERCGLPTSLPKGSDPDALLAHMRLDKKNRGGHLRLILWRGLGHAEMVVGVDETKVREFLAAAAAAA